MKNRQTNDIETRGVDEGVLVTFLLLMLEVPEGLAENVIIREVLKVVRVAEGMIGEGMDGKIITRK